MSDTPPALERVGLDVGGSSIKAGRASANGAILRETTSAIPPGCSPESFTRLLLAAARELGAEGSIGVGLPGLLDREFGGIAQSPNLPYLDGLPLRAILARELGIAPERVALENDANAAALGEQWLGAASRERDFLLLTLGTGVGGGLVLGGELYTGLGQAGEIGHLVVDPRGLPCGCGARGCLETLASASAARRRALELGLPAERPGDLPLLSARARAAAGPERELLREIGRDLGRGLGPVVCLLDLGCFVFGGGFAAALDQLEPGIREGIRERSYGARHDKVRLLGARLGGSAGWIGAARLALARR